MDAREDALCGAAELVLALREAARRAGAVATVGQLEVKPGAVNVIPGEVHLSYDVRGAGDEQIDAVLAIVPGEPELRFPTSWPLLCGRSRARCCSFAASTAARAIRPTRNRAMKTWRSRSTC